MAIQNILLAIAYDGTNFKGFQIQNDERTIQAELERAVRAVTGENNRIIAAGRTDAGVHANLMYVNFLTASNIRADKFHYHLKEHLPDDILALFSKKAYKNFHARFSVKKKRYKYVISLKERLHPIYRNYMENISYKLNFSLLEKGLDILKGEHDFRAFCLNDDNSDTINTVRKIDDAYLRLKGDRLYLYFEGESFLHNQVRLMAGSLIKLARGKISLDEFKFYLNKDNKKKAGPNLKAAGLYLDNIDYKFWWELKMSKKRKENKGFNFDKKPILIGLGALILLVVIFFISRSLDFTSGSGKSSDEISENSYNSSKIMRVDLNDIKEIEFDLKTSDVRIEESNTNPYVEYTNLYKDDSSYEVDVNFKDGRLKLSSKVKGKELYMKNKIQIVRIFLPKDSKISSLSGKVGAGDIKISSLKTDDMKLRLESGNISFDKSDISGSIYNKSGTISVKNSNLENTNLKTVVGDVLIEDSKLKANEKFESENGDIRVKTKDPIDSFNIKARLNVGNFVIGSISYRNILDGYLLDNKKDKTIEMTTNVGDIIFNQGEGVKIDDEEYYTSPKDTNDNSNEEDDDNFKTPVDKSEIKSPLSNQEKSENTEEEIKEDSEEENTEDENIENKEEENN